MHKILRLGGYRLLNTRKRHTKHRDRLGNLEMTLQFEVCRFVDRQSVLKIPFQIAKTCENAKAVLKIIFSTVKLY